MELVLIGKEMYEAPVAAVVVLQSESGLCAMSLPGGERQDYPGFDWI